MKNFTVTKRFLSFCLLYLLYILMGEIWFILLYTHDKWITYTVLFFIAIILVPLYTFINIRISLGIERYIFYIPILPFFIGALLFRSIELSLFPNLYTQDDLGAGILMFMIAIPHWASMMFSFWLSETIKTRRKEG